VQDLEWFAARTAFSSCVRIGSPCTIPRMKTNYLLEWCAIGCLAVSGVHAADVPVDLRTRAEASDFRATSGYDETLSYLRRLEALSPYIKVGSFGSSEQGRSLPLVIVSRDKAFTAAKARRLAKPIVLIQSGIFAGEKEWIEGPELEVLARELLKEPKVAAEWDKALLDPAFAANTAARSEWWWRRTPYWDETVGLMPVYRAMRPLPGFPR